MSLILEAINSLLASIIKWIKLIILNLNKVGLLFLLVLFNEALGHSLIGIKGIVVIFLIPLFLFSVNVIGRRKVYV